MTENRREHQRRKRNIHINLNMSQKKTAEYRHIKGRKTSKDPRNIIYNST